MLLGLNAIGLVNDPDWIRWTALIVQIELIFTAVVGWCPILWGFGTNTCAIGSAPGKARRRSANGSDHHG